MKNIILTLSMFMMVGLIISTYMYQNQNANKIEDTLQSVNEQEEPQPVALQAINNEKVSYTLQNEALHITYNEGNDWVKVPIEKELLFAGEYSGNEQELMEESYILTENRTAFLYSEDGNSEANRIVLTYSLDQGKIWQKSVVTDVFSPLRFRKVDFVDDDFGYVIISGDRTMSQEYSIVYVTEDGGKTWEATAELPTTRLIAFGGFTDEMTGFLSYGTINPEEPDFYVTQDQGDNWIEAVFHIPEKYDRIFVQAEVPVKEEKHLAVLVNQGPNGDYEGGKIKGKFISEDNGLTWSFSMEVEPSETD